MLDYGIKASQSHITFVQKGPNVDLLREIENPKSIGGEMTGSENVCFCRT
jgi:hypothetical protein